MPRQSIILQVFVASPSDVSEERLVLDGVISELNQIWAKNLGITFEILKWENNVRPSFSSDPQAVINAQINADYDVFIGIFWSRLGTPTPRAPSGTIEEFERAYARHLNSKSSPEIMLYFKETPLSPAKIDASQLKQLQEFRASLSGKGGLFSTFDDQSGFESSLRAHLSAIAQKFPVQRTTSLPRQLDKELHALAETTEHEDDEDGFLDHLEIYEARTEDMATAMNAINEATLRVGEQLSLRSTEIRNEAPTDPSAVRRLMKRVADDMNNYAETIGIQVTTLSKSRKSAFSALSNSLALFGDFSNSKANLRSAKKTLSSLIVSAEGARSSLSNMQASTDALPRISKDINKAKRIVVQQLDSLLSEIDSITSTVHNIIEAIDRLLDA